MWDFVYICVGGWCSIARPGNDDDQTLEKISVDFTCSHSWLIMKPYLGWVGGCKLKPF